MHPTRPLAGRVGGAVAQGGRVPPLVACGAALRPRRASLSAAAALGVRDLVQAADSITGAPRQQPSQPPVHEQREGATSSSSSTVEVHFQVQYGCNFGQRLALISSSHAWEASAAQHMAWSEGDVWSAVAPVPVGCEWEYKYVVLWEDTGSLARWQDGFNLKLAVPRPGVLLHVTDSWSQSSRQVREVGKRLELAPEQQHAGSGSTSSDSKDSSSSSSSKQQGSDGTAAALNAAAAAPANAVPATPPAGFADRHGSSGGTRVVSPPPPPPAHEARRVADEGSSSSKPRPATLLQKASAAARPDSASERTAGVDATAVPALSPMQQQLEVSAKLAALLPKLRHQLEAALEELASVPGAAGKAAGEQAALLREGQAILEALQQRESARPGGAAASVSSGSVQAARAPTVAGGKAVGKPPGSPGASAAAASLASGDEIAAALLSDDDEEACSHLHDAICSCSDWDVGCSCDEEHSHDEQPSVPAGSGDAAATLAASRHVQATITGSGSAGDSHASTAASHAPAARVAAPLVAAASTNGSSASPQAAAAASVAVVSSTSSSLVRPLSAVALARAAADANPDVLAARAAALADVQSALERSSSLLASLPAGHDPGHPLLLAADRSLASASREMQTATQLLS